MALDRILIVSHSFAPEENPRALRWSSIARYWAAQGLKVDVITAYHPGMPEADLYHGVTVYRTGRNIVENLRSRFKERVTASDSGEETSHFPPTRLARSARWLHEHTWKKLYWPDYACFWIKPAGQAVHELISNRKYSAIISVSDPYSSHVAVYRALKGRSHPRWLVDLGDPFSSRTLAAPNNQSLYKSLNYRTEQAILAHCSALTVTTTGTAEEYRERFSEVGPKLHVIGPLFSPPPPSVEASPTAGALRKKTLVYIGTLYPELRSPEYLLRVFEQLIQQPEFGDLELHFYGGTTSPNSLFNRFRSLIDKSLFVHGLVPRQQALMAMLNAHILVNIGNQTSVQLPSKIVEYVWAGRPILNIASHPSDSAAAYLQGYPSLLSLSATDSISVAENVVQLADFVRGAGREIPRSAIAPFQERSSLQIVANQYAGLCGINTASRKLTDRQPGISIACQ